MESFIPAHSPLFAYSPCKGCGVGSTGWKSSNGTNDAGVTGSVGKLSIGFNFTGTGVAFSFTQPIPADWEHTLQVNSSAPPPSAQTSSNSIMNLPLGTHRFTLDLFPPIPDPFAPSTSTPPNVHFTGAVGYLGTMLTAATKNITVDDSAWRTFGVILSPGWNMLEGGEGGASNWINTTQVDEERSRAGENWGSSESWTTQRDANTTIKFEGEAFWVYGAIGPEAGRYEVLFDGLRAGVYNGSAITKEYGQVLYHTSSLAKGEHNVTLRNMDEGRRLTFDRLVAMTGTTAALSRPIPVFSPAPSSTSSATGIASSNKLSNAQLAGIAIGAILAVLCFIGGVLFFLWKRDSKKRKEPKEDAYSTEKFDDRNQTFFKWPRSSTPPFSRMDLSPTRQGFFDKLWNIKPNTEVSTNQSFVPGMPDDPRTYNKNFPIPPPEDRYTSFMKFSKSPRSKERLPISSPVPFDRPEISPRVGSPEMGMSPALAAALSGRVVSPLAALRDGDIPVKSGREGESKSYLPKMTSVGAMFPKSQVSDGNGGNHWKRPSMDTIGRIFGAHANPRDTAAPTSGIPGNGEADIGTIQGREKWDERVRHAGQPHAF